MSEKFDVSATEMGLVRLFKIDLPPEEIDAFGDDSDGPGALETALGVQYLDRGFVDLFPVDNLEGVGLAVYMVEGLGVSEAEVDPVREQLNTIEGHVLVVLSRAFGGEAATLTPNAPLRWIGTFVEDRAAVQFEPLSSDAAEMTPTPEAKRKPSDAAMSGRVATVALLVLFALTFLVVWIAS